MGGGIPLKERLFCLTFIGLSLLLPALFTEAYPFSSYPMFNYRLEQVTVFHLVGPDGRLLNPEEFGVATTTCGETATNPVHQRRGRIRTNDINVVGRGPISQARAQQRLRQALVEKGLPYLDVEQVSRNSDGEVETLKYRVLTPSLEGDSP